MCFKAVAIISSIQNKEMKDSGLMLSLFCDILDNLLMVLALFKIQSMAASVFHNFDTKYTRGM